MLCFNWVGLFLCMLGIFFVGLAEALGSSKGLSGSKDTVSTVFGMFMVVAAQMVQAMQLVAEEWLMKDVDLPMMEIVGWEGFWGCVLMGVVFYPVLYVLPGHDNGHMEDAFDTVYQIMNSTAVATCAIVYIFSCATFNATGIAVTGALSAVHRIIIVAISTMVIWVFGLCVHEFYDENAEFGEVWTPYSWFQLFGFGVLILGQMVYGEMIKVPGLRYPEPLDKTSHVSP